MSDEHTVITNIFTSMEMFWPTWENLLAVKTETRRHHRGAVFSYDPHTCVSSTHVYWIPPNSGPLGVLTLSHLAGSTVMVSEIGGVETNYRADGETGVYLPVGIESRFPSSATRGWDGLSSGLVSLARGFRNHGRMFESNHTDGSWADHFQFFESRFRLTSEQIGGSTFGVDYMRPLGLATRVPLKPLAAMISSKFSVFLQRILLDFNLSLHHWMQTVLPWSIDDEGDVEPVPTSDEPITTSPSPQPHRAVPSTPAPVIVQEPIKETIMSVSESLSTTFGEIKDLTTKGGKLAFVAAVGDAIYDIVVQILNRFGVDFSAMYHPLAKPVMEYFGAVVFLLLMNLAPAGTIPHAGIVATALKLLIEARARDAIAMALNPMVEWFATQVPRLKEVLGDEG